MIQRKQNGRRELASISESEILRIKDNAVLQNKGRATKFGLKVFKDKRSSCFCQPLFFQIIIAEN